MEIITTKSKMLEINYLADILIQIKNNNTELNTLRIDQISILNKLRFLHNNLDKFYSDLDKCHKNKKKRFGQFYTTNYAYILKNMYIPDNINNIIEPFAGQCDLIKFIDKYQKNRNILIECYDIDVKKPIVKYRDTLINPPNYSKKFILTNPPYLARNKSKNKIIFDKYKQNDLYKCFISDLTINKCVGGIIIVPVNFWCSIRKNDILLRKTFIQTYDIVLINVFEEPVFKDTTYAICSFQFKLRNSSNDYQNDNIIKCDIYKNNKIQNTIEFILSNNNNFTVGGEIYNLNQSEKINVSRLTSNNINNEFRTNILLKCIDDSILNKINISITDDIYIDNTPKLSARSYATLVIEPKLNINQINILINKFNLYLNDKRKQYNSLFLTNYRDSNTIARKRISFNLAFNIINHILHTQIITTD
jgi:hypothetical protein